jgi:hypothetical protein
LDSTAATSETIASAMVMGDTVLFEDEVNAVMSVALDNGLSVTALHNHFFFDEPKVYFMHIEGEGSVDKLAGAPRYPRRVQSRPVPLTRYSAHKGRSKTAW